MELHLGIDDTDSPKGMCTTYLAAIILEQLVSFCEFKDFPRLVRLNPNIPFKTKGNAAVAFHLESNNPERVWDIAESILMKMAHLDFSNTNPGLCLVKGSIDSHLENIAWKALRSFVPLQDVERAIDPRSCIIKGYNEKRGIVGAIAAIGLPFHDFTYELISYRIAKNRGIPSNRRIDQQSVFKADQLTKPLTFTNLDYRKRKILITPHGPDPVFAGIRGETPEAVLSAWKIIEPLESIERWVIFRTNQGTDQHFEKPTIIARLSLYTPANFSGIIITAPKKIQGGHVFFKITDNSGEILCCAYEPTKSFRDIIIQLKIGDTIHVWGGVHLNKKTKKKALNLEMIKIIKLIERIEVQNPVCECGKRMKSEGRNKGFQCEVCKSKLPENARIVKKVPLSLKENSQFVVPAGSHRHLAKPPIRYGQEKKKPFSGHKLLKSGKFWCLGDLHG